jgi:hypothetical protein
MEDQSMPAREQDYRLWHWLVELFSNPWDILTDVREVFANVADAVDRPATLRIGDEESDEESDDEEMEEDDGEFINDEDVEMTDVDDEDEDHQEAAEEYVRYHLRS